MIKLLFKVRHKYSFYGFIAKGRYNRPFLYILSKLIIQSVNFDNMNSNTDLDHGSDQSVNKDVDHII